MRDQKSPVEGKGWAEGQVGLVTGGTSGIGRATVMALARAGANIVVVGLKAKRGAEVVAEVEELGREAAFVCADVSQEADAERMVGVTLDQFGRLDFACNAAGVSSTTGVSKSTAITDFETADWERVLSVNLTGIWLSMKHELLPMIAAGKGAIVNVSSVAGLVGVPNSSAYCASKHGVIGLTRSAALETASRGVRINVVCPGVVETPMLESVFAAQPERREAYADANPLRRIATPEEQADVIAFLCSPGSTYMTGAVIPVDGGWTAR